MIFLGMQIGRLKVLDFVGLKPRSGVQWKCGCWCGNYSIVLERDLTRTKGRTESCGRCYLQETFKKEWNAWNAAKYRCRNEKHEQYKDYGGRGIKMCSEWEYDFCAFIEHIGMAPSSAHSLDRYPDNNKGYEPGNVRWATHIQQLMNRRNTLPLTKHFYLLTAKEP